MDNGMPRIEDALTAYQSEVLHCVYAFLHKWGRGATVAHLARECHFKPTRHFRKALKEVEKLGEFSSWVAYQESGHLARYYGIRAATDGQLTMEIPF